MMMTIIIIIIKIIIIIIIIIVCTDCRKGYSVPDRWVTNSWWE